MNRTKKVDFGRYLNRISDKKRAWAAHFCSPITAPQVLPVAAGLGLALGLAGMLMLVVMAAMVGTVSAATAQPDLRLLHVGPLAGITLLAQKRNELNAKRADLKRVFEEAGADRDFTKVKCLGDNMTTVAKVEKVRAMNSEIDDIAKEVEGLADMEQIASGLKGAEPDDAKAAGIHPDGDRTKAAPMVKSIGRLIIESPAFKNFSRAEGRGPGAEIEVELKTLFESAAGWSPESLRTGIVTDYPTRPAPHVVDFIPQIPTTQADVKYMEETTFTNNASETTPGSAAGEAALALTERSKSVQKIAVWIPVTEEQLEDVPMAEAYINGRLMLMAKQRLDSQVLVGTGVMPSGLTGTENVSGIQTQALGSDSLPDAIYKLFTSIRDDGFAEPSVLFIRPSKWQGVALLKTADGIYIWGHPSEAGPARIWGVPVVQTTACTSTKAVAGDYRTHSFLAMKAGLEVQISNSHDDFFAKGKLAIRARMRGAMIHLRPKAFGVVTGL